MAHFEVNFQLTLFDHPSQPGEDLTHYLETCKHSDTPVLRMYLKTYGCDSDYRMFTAAHLAESAISDFVCWLKDGNYIGSIKTTWPKIISMQMVDKATFDKHEELECRKIPIWYVMDIDRYACIYDIRCLGYLRDQRNVAEREDAHE